MSSVTIRAVKKKYGTLTVLHGIDLNIQDQEFVVLVGPSGCGKSTLLRMIAGLESVTAGDILIGDRIVNDVPAKSRDIAMVFQNYALYPHMTVFENMGFSLKLKKMTKEVIDSKVRGAAEILNLSKYLERSPRQLSGGQRQRVAMGRALVRDAHVFLFDEPLSNLDAKLRVVMRAEIKALHQRLQTTSVYVTHDQIEAMTMADRIVVMNAGNIEQIGTPLELYDTPANLFVAGFIGSPSMNFLHGTLERDALVLANGTRLPLPDLMSGSVGQKAVLGIRPEHLSLSTEGVGVAAQVTLVEPTGANIQVYAKVATAPLCAIFTERHNFKLGQTLHLTWAADKVHLFDEASGRRL